MRILALDLATSTGWATWSPGSPVLYGSRRLPDTGKNVGAFMSRFERWLTDMIAVHESVDRIIYEAPWVGPQTHQATAMRLIGMACGVERLCFDRGLAIHKANNASVRKHFIGKGSNSDRATLKRMTVDACLTRGWTPANDDEADALALLDYAAHIWRVPTEWAAGPLMAGGTHA